VLVDSAAGLRALTFMRDQIVRWRIVPRDVLTWHEEETRFAFQNGRAAFMRNWPYAAALLRGPDSRVAGRFAVGALPAGPGGRAAAALGGSQLAINAHSDHPGAAWEVIAFLTAPEQMLERALVAGQYPARISVFDDPRLEKALALPVGDVREILQQTVARPVTPLYSQLSDALQIELHRALASQVSPQDALRRAAARMEAIIRESGIRERKSHAAGG
jgi:multiple sugar transport system substrate-binding protein